MSAGIKANSDGSAAIQVGGSDAITITSGLAVSINGGVNYPLVSGTAVASTSGTSIDFTGIPSTAKRITVMFRGVSLSGASPLLIQLGTSSGIEITGYVGQSIYINGASAGSSAFPVTGIQFYGMGGAANAVSGTTTLTLLNSNIWTAHGGIAGDASNVTAFVAGSKTTASTLNRVRITATNGTDTFDAGTINIMWE